MAGLTRRIWNTLTGQTEKSLVSPEGSWRGPFTGTGELGGQFLFGSLEDGWQRNLQRPYSENRFVGPVYSVVMLYARAISQCATQHMVDDGNGGFTKSGTSPASRIFRKPNDYETWTQIIFNTAAEMLFEGESLWVASRDERNAIASVHRISRKSWTVHVDQETGEIFYGIYKNDGLTAREFGAMVPARDVCHFRQHCPRHPLIGESPARAAAMSIGLNVALTESQLAFFNNMSRPSGIISTDQVMNADQIKRLKEAWENASTALAQGKVPVLVNGLKFQPITLPQTDQQLIEQQKLSIADIARVYGVPVALISENTGTQGGTEALISHWLSIGLGSLIESIERSLDRLFQLPANEHVQLDPTPLLRVDFASRIDGLVKAVQGGLLTPNEARGKEGFGKANGGDSAFMQQQMVPVELLLELHTTDLDAKKNPPEPAAPPAEPVDEPDPETTKALVVNMLEYKRKAA